MSSSADASKRGVVFNGVRFDGVLFDCDGVLVDSERITSRVWAGLLTGIGLPTTTEQSLATYLGNSMPRCLEIVTAQLGRTPPDTLLPRFYAEVQVALRPGFSSGQGIAAMEALAAKALPSGFALEWTEIALQEKLAGSTAILAFSLAVVFVFLLLAALYESWLLPLAVILIVPMCVLAAMIGVNLRGLDRNILVDQTMVNDFRPFGAKMAKLSTQAKTIERDDGTKTELTRSARR